MIQTYIRYIETRYLNIRYIETPSSHLQEPLCHCFHNTCQGFSKNREGKSDGRFTKPPEGLRGDLITNQP